MKNIVPHKAILSFFIFAAMLLASAPTRAQPAASEYVLPGNRGVLPLVCATRSGDILQYNRDMSSSTYRFTLHTPGTAAASQFEFSATATPLGVLDYSVNDMRVVDDWCYFCGHKATPVGNEWNGLGWVMRYDSVGYVGRFSLSVFSSTPGPAQLEITRIPGSTTLDRMVCLDQSPDMLIALVGTADDASRSSCVVSVRYRSSSWSYLLKKVSYPVETFTDVAVTDHQIAVVSRNDQLTATFNLRWGTHADWLSGTSMSDLDTRYTFLTLPPSAIAPFPVNINHENDATIRIYGIPYHDQLDVAYECMPAGNRCNTALFKVDLARPPQVSGAQIVRGIYSTTGHFASIRHMAYDNSAALLYTEPSHPIYMSALLLPNWNGQTPWTMPFADKAIGAVDIYGTNIIYMAGSMPGLEQVHLTQWMSSFTPPIKFCHKKEQLDIFQKVPTSMIEQDDALVVYKSDRLSWELIEGDVRDTKVEVVCEKDDHIFEP